MVARVELALWRRGIWIRNLPRRPLYRRVGTFGLPSTISSLRVGEYPRRFAVPPEKVVTPFGFGFGSHGWHPYIHTLNQIDNEGTVPYEQSALARFYTRYQPTSLADALAVRPEEACEELRGLPSAWPILRDIWLMGPSDLAAACRRAHATTLTQRNAHIGPMSDEGGRRHYERLIDVYASLRQHGYDPLRFDYQHANYPGQGEANGYFLWDGADYRFVVLHGHHRLAAAAHLREAVLHVCIRRRYIPVIELDRLSARAFAPWASTALAQLLFSRLFTSDGAQKCREWRLMDL